MKPSKAEKKREKNAFKRAFERRSNKQYYFFIAGTVLLLTCYPFFPHTIGYDIKYTVFVIVTPIVSGLVLFLLYEKKFYRLSRREADGPKWQHAYFYMLVIWFVSVFSYVTFGVAASVAWEAANYYKASQSKQEIVTLPINESRTRSSGSSVYFDFNDRLEHIKLHSSAREALDGQNEEKHIRLTIRKGIWNYYIVDDWKVIP